MVSKANTVNISNMPVTSEKVFSPNEHADFKTLFHDINEEWKITKFEVRAVAVLLDLQPNHSVDYASHVFIPGSLRQWTLRVP